MAKRTYKALTKKQTASVKRYTKAGKTQRQIAKALGVSKQRVSTAQAKVKVGKRRPSPFWKDVKLLKEKSGYSHTKATKEVMNWKSWGTKRASKIVWYTTDKHGNRIKHVGKKWKSYEDRQNRMRELRREFEGEDLDKALTDEVEEYSYGDTPH